MRRRGRGRARVGRRGSTRASGGCGTRARRRATRCRCLRYGWIAIWMPGCSGFGGRGRLVIPGRSRASSTRCRRRLGSAWESPGGGERDWEEGVAAGLGGGKGRWEEDGRGGGGGGWGGGGLLGVGLERGVGGGLGRGGCLAEK